MAALLLSSLLAACSGTPGQEGDVEARLGRQASAVQGGTNDTGVTHNYAVGVANKGGRGGVCSGTLIAPNLVLTARHCVVPPSADESVTCADSFAPNVAPSAVFITTEPNLYRAEKYYAAAKIITPAATGFCGNDIALIILQKEVPESEAKPATPVVQFKLTDARLSGSITAVGYGITNPSATDSGQRRIRENIPLLCIPGSKDMECSGTLAQFSDDAAEFVTEGHVCSGDSGGGAFDQKSFEGGAPFVLGALSRGPQTKDKCLAAVYSRTDAHAQLIIEAGLEAAAKSGSPAPLWTQPGVGSAESADEEPACEGEPCTDTSATEPSAPVSAGTKVTTSSGCSASRSAVRTGSSSGAALLGGLALATVLARRRRRAS